jgi:hypothetical protein
MSHTLDGEDGMTPDIEALLDQLDAATREAQELASALTDEQAMRKPPGGWSVAECIEHLALTNRDYLVAMRTAADSARAQGKLRRGPAKPGLFGGFFAKRIEPPARAGFRFKAPETIVPRASIRLSEALEAFAASQEEIRAFLLANADLDLARIIFRNPFISGIRFSLATGLHVMLAHERRHLWQAKRVVNADEVQLAKSVN